MLMFKYIFGDSLKKIFKNFINTEKSLDHIKTIQNNEFLHLFHKELYSVILNQIDFFPIKITNESLHSYGIMCLNIALTNKKFHQHLKTTLYKLSRIHFLYTKYSYFNREYENPDEYFLGSRDNYNYNDPPLLIDALNSGCTLPYAQHSVKVVNFDDIKEIVHLIPTSLHSNIAQLRCRTHITPFITAVFNPNIPKCVLVFLLDHGCNPYTKLKLNGYDIDLIKDIENCDPDRHDLLINILKER